MASKTYSTDSITIRKTRLSDSDLILTLVTSDRGLVRAVAKSSRKPGNTFSNRLDLFNVARITCASCKNLDIVRECRLIETFPNIRSSYLLQTIAGSVCELAWRCTFDGETSEHLFDFLYKTFDCINSSTFDSSVLQSAALIKLLAIEGFRPSTSICARCGSSIDFSRVSDFLFSYKDGGVVCPTCVSAEEPFSDIVSSNVLRTMQIELSSTYKELSQVQLFDSQDSKRVLEILDRWIRFHIGYKLKSLDILKF